MLWRAEPAHPRKEQHVLASGRGHITYRRTRARCSQVGYLLERKRRVEGAGSGCVRCRFAQSLSPGWLLGTFLGCCSLAAELPKHEKNILNVLNCILPISTSFNIFHHHLGVFFWLIPLFLCSSSQP